MSLCLLFSSPLLQGGQLKSTPLSVKRDFIKGWGLRQLMGGRLWQITLYFLSSPPLFFSFEFSAPLTISSPPHQVDLGLVVATHIQPATPILMCSVPGYGASRRFFTPSSSPLLLLFSSPTLLLSFYSSSPFSSPPHLLLLSPYSSPPLLLSTISSRHPPLPFFLSSSPPPPLLTLSSSSPAPHLLLLSPSSPLHQVEALTDTNSPDWTLWA